jgi:hypothetical protein
MKSPLKRKPLRNPGQTLDEEIQRLFEDKVFSYLWFVGGFFILALMEWYGYLTSSPRRPWLFTCAALVTLAWAAWKIVPLRRHIAGLKQGRDGERAVGHFLERLRSTGAHVLHDIPGDDFNLDHVVISERGIFVVETKTKDRKKAKEWGSKGKVVPKRAVIQEGEKARLCGSHRDDDVGAVHCRSDDGRLFQRKQSHARA